MKLDTTILDHSSFEKDTSFACKVMEFSPDGRMLAWCNSQCVTVFDFRDGGKIIQRIPRQKTNMLAFSVRNKYLITWETFVVNKENPQGQENLELWDIASGDRVKGFYNKKRENSMLRWSDDEKVCARCVTNEIHFFEDGNFETICHKLRLQGVASIDFAQGPAPYKIATYVRGSKAAPSFVRLFQYPNFNSPSSALANKSFFKAEKADIKWNKIGTAALIVTSTEVDQTGGSYYGEQGLHFIATNGESNVVALGKKGPIYAIDWNPNSLQFSVVYGYMPAKATLFDLKCEPIFDFGTGPRNTVHYNAHGNIICLAGFGNLRGQLEFWDLKQLREINKIQASDSTMFEWCPDGQHFVTATTSPRLREGNGYKIWHYNGECIIDNPINELWQVSWQPCVDGMFPETVVTSAVQATKANSEAYRPPQARGTKSNLKLHDVEPAQNQKPRELSGAALKNKKKRDSKARSKQETVMLKDEINSESVPESVSTLSPDKEKKLRNLKKKLRQIEELKELKKDGKQLEKNQEDKLSSEDNLLEEIRSLELS